MSRLVWKISCDVFTGLLVLIGRGNCPLHTTSLMTDFKQDK
jgi:hypothetical protein